MRGLGLNLSQERMGGSFGTTSLGSRFGNPMSNIPVLNKPVTSIPSTLKTSVTTTPLPGPSTGSPSSGKGGDVRSKIRSIINGESKADLGKVTFTPGHTDLGSMSIGTGGGATQPPKQTVAPTPPATTGPSTTTTPPSPPPTAVPVSNPEAVSGPYTGGSLSI